MKKFKYSTFADCIKRFKGKRVLVVGDLLLDKYIFGDVTRISPEAPVPVVWAKNEEYKPGGSCNVAYNLVSLGAKVRLSGVIGDDIRGKLLREELEDMRIDVEGVFTDSSRPTSLKTRVIAHSQQIVRIDAESVNTVDRAVIKKIGEHIINILDDVDGVIIEDYGKGVVTPELLRKIVPVMRKKKKIIAVDPKEDHFEYYKGVSVITPNHHEAATAVGFKIKDDISVQKAGEQLLKKLKTDNILITLGEEGMMLFDKDRKTKKIPTVAQEVFDVSGAGDTVIAVYTLAAVSGGSPIISAHIANCAAGIVVGKVGTAVIDPSELLAKLKELTSGRRDR